MALDALKNLCTQAYLMSRDDLALAIINLGYVACVTELVKKALAILDADFKA